MDRSKVVVVGYGFAGRCFHTYLVGLASQLQLYGVVSSRPEARVQIQSQLGVKVFARFEEVLADPAVDLVVLATPNDLHASQAIQALEAGKHVVTDKPMSLSTAEADAMIAASRKSGRLLSVFQNRRWDGDFLTVRQVMAEGLLGEVFSMELCWGQYGLPRGWRSQQQHGGGKFMDLGAHLLDQALQLVPGPVEWVYARFFAQGWQTDVEDHALCLLSFASGVEVQICTSSLARRPRPRWYVMGTKGTLIKEGVDPQERAMIAGQIDAAREEPAQYPRLWVETAGRSSEVVLEPVPGRWRSYYENIAEAINDPAKLAVTPESVRRVMALIEAARASAASGQAVRPEGEA
ncbi:MAG: Gfo/Idh/MocA family oxidoreductase [Candidatus Latescibacteria bacterium]|nr:Gfo/Idh/MocA family oxidoreductase [Candidatus Latescibacterota bacterium]